MYRFALDSLTSCCCQDTIILSILLTEATPYVQTCRYVYIDTPICLRISGHMLQLRYRCHVLMYTCKYVYIDVPICFRISGFMLLSRYRYIPWCMYIHVRVCIQMYWSASQSLATCCCSDWGVTYTCTYMKLCVYRCTDLPQDLWPHVAVKIQVSCMYIHTRQYVYIDVPICLRISGCMLLLRLRCHVRMYIHVNMFI